jgi:hypothetical protein
VSFIDALRRARARLAASCAAVIAACAPPAPAPAPAPKPGSPPRTSSAAAAAREPVSASAPRELPPPGAVHSWTQLRLQAAHRMVQANPDGTYLGRPPDVLLAIPVLEIELNRDGSVRRIDVLRNPRQAHDTLQLAVAAVHRAAPFGDVSRLPRPWKFAETFLFDDARRFKPRSLDDG